MLKEQKGKWDSDWQSALKPRIYDRAARYPGGPAAGSGIIKKYYQYYDRATKNIKDPEVLVLGATPELRDYALSKGAKVTAIDFKKEILDTMAKVMEHGDSENESRVVGNWLDMPFEDNAFDFVWGDGITNNILFDDHDKFFTEIIRILKPQGHFLLRDALVDSDQEDIAVEEAIDWYKGNKIHRYDLFFKIYCHTTARHIDRKRYLIDMAKIDQYMKDNIYGKDFLEKDEEDFLKEFMSGNVKSTFVPRDLWIDKFKKYFDLLEVGVAEDYLFCKYFNFFYSKPL